MTTIELEPEERAMLMRWKKRMDTHRLIRLKTEALLLADAHVATAVIAQFVERSEKTVAGWLADWAKRRGASLATGHAGNQNAAKLTRDQKDEVAKILAAKPSEAGLTVEFWDVPALADVVSAEFDVQYDSDSSYQLLMRYAGLSFKKADPFDKRRDEQVITARMAQISAQVEDLKTQGYAVYAADEVRVEHESETRRMWLRRGERTKLYVDRRKHAKSFFGALDLTDGTMKVYPIDGRQNTEQIIFALARLQRETSQEKIAVVVDNASFHRSEELMAFLEPGNSLERTTLIYLPPYAPDHNPVEHVWNAAKGHIANYQRDEPEHTYSAFISYITSRKFEYEFEHTPIRPQESDLVS